ncbi:MAG: glutathione S-transferase family protein [Emcibacter sp.]|nr:glutathione S-transferase family protein [Emcibacter sp.]
MAMKLYHRPDCPFCWKVRIFLKEIDVDVEEVTIALGEKNPDIMALNPNGTVPVFMDGDLLLWESAVIIEYLADKYPAAALMSGSAIERADIRQIHGYSDSRVGKILFPYIKHVREKGLDFLGHDTRQATTEGWGEIQKILSERLGNKKFFGPNFSAADCALIPRVTLALAYGLTFGDDVVNLKKWYRECVKRPSFLATLPAVLPGIDEMIKPDLFNI